MIGSEWGNREWDSGVSPLDERIHPVSVQPKKPDCELPKIIPIWTDRKTPRSPECVRSLLFQWRKLTCHR
jgi:hypothetical protein